MSHNISRRRFLSLSAMAGATAPFLTAGNLLAASRFKSSITFGYSAITWGGKDDVAIKEISQLGFRGIQLRANAYQTYGTKVDELKKLLKDAKLELAMFSSGNANPSATGDDDKTSVSTSTETVERGTRVMASPFSWRSWICCRTGD